ncbi:MAG: ATP-grasp domain-containing protein [Bdellovibrionales bacterium]|nr:ATP-grasp domain-containing protein [Bdellovibrionales bacterium]
MKSSGGAGGAKILVANRSEIACRVFQTAREMGIRTVGIFAPGDEEARHLTFADEVHPVASYLDVGAVVEAAVKSKATMVHPGYGFLSERPVLPQGLEKAGITFLGPRPETMEALGGKIAAKELAEKSGVPTLPWAKVPKGGDLKAAAKKVGFPLLLKAAAGGGGKGMRKVTQEKDLESAAESASAEAISSFGDGTLFIEKLVEKPRHIEVQVFGDGHGGAVHLYERECTLQRRHQKVWEEARAPHLSEKTREGLFKAALALSQAVKYRSAGTLEFLVDDDGSFYFLEMNTRLQVEHPVTELVTGVDLVRAMIQLGLDPSKSPLKETPTARGHAIEVRLYAEDAAQGFMPTPGKIEKIRWPMGPGIRVDSGIEEGQTIGTSFDSMLGKLIVSAETREWAVAKMQVALDDLVILGMGHNQPYLQAIGRHPDVIAGKVDTHFLERVLGGFDGTPSKEELALAVAFRQAGLARAGAGSAGHTPGCGAAAFASPWFAGGANKGAI